MRVLVTTMLLMTGLAGCEARYDAAKQLSHTASWQCVYMDGREADKKCAGKSVELTGFVRDYDDGKYKIGAFRTNERGEFALLGRYGEYEIDSQILIRGVVVDGGFGAHLTTIKAHEVDVVASAPKEQRQSHVSPEAEIARYREMGERALEEADAAIRQNNESMRSELAAKAITHHTNSSSDVRVDVYGMPDGRHIACKTVVYASGAPITTCDGEP